MLQDSRFADARITPDFDITGLIERSMNSSNAFGTRESDIPNPIADIRKGGARSFGDGRARREMPPISSQKK